MDCYINTIYDKQNQEEYINHCNEFDHNHDFQVIFWKSDDALLVFDVLDNNVCLYLIDYYKCVLLVYLFD